MKSLLRPHIASPSSRVGTPPPTAQDEVLSTDTKKRAFASVQCARTKVEQ